MFQTVGRFNSYPCPVFKFIYSPCKHHSQPTNLLIYCDLRQTYPRLDKGKNPSAIFSQKISPPEEQLVNHFLVTHTGTFHLHNQEAKEEHAVSNFLPKSPHSATAKKPLPIPTMFLANTCCLIIYKVEPSYYQSGFHTSLRVIRRRCAKQPHTPRPVRLSNRR